MTTAAADHASAVYADIAPYYEAFTASYPHRRWLGTLERLACAHGLRARRVLDIGCGTGKSLEPLLELGYEGEGCDISWEMLQVAADRLSGVSLHQGDVRDLPPLGPYPWVIAINDTLNYLLGDDDLFAALASVASVLEPGGLFTFDLNTRLGHRALYERTWTVRTPRQFLCWCGGGWDPLGNPVAETEIVIFANRAGVWRETVTRHRQRWWSDHDVVAAARRAGLRVIARYGQRVGAHLELGCDERHHTKVVYFLRRGGGEDSEGGAR